ncbi:MAG: hypothetical protein ACQEQV_10800, partial [Fibrobacterota bacterium]
NSIRQDPFFRVDARVEKKYVTKRLMVTAYLDFQNISYFFHKNAETYIYDDFNIQREPVAMVPLINSGVTIEF